MAKAKAGGYTHGLMSQAPRILVVDDMKDTAWMVTLMLESRGYSTAHAFDGRRALAAVRDFRPDVILLNWGMPGLDGLDVLDALKARKETARIKVIMTSALPRAALFRDAGADGFLPLPFSIPLAEAAIRHVLQPGPAEFVVASTDRLVLSLGAR
jgi:CheY-like chemotaxis protein